jgi:hypothetical protein
MNPANQFLPHADKLKGSLYGMLVGDALAVPGHWFYSPQKLRDDYGEIQGMVAPKPNHAESMVQGMSYHGSIDIMHDKARFYEGNALAQKARRSWQFCGHKGKRTSALSWILIERTKHGQCLHCSIGHAVYRPSQCRKTRPIRSE